STPSPTVPPPLSLPRRSSDLSGYRANRLSAFPYFLHRLSRSPWNDEFCGAGNRPADLFHYPNYPHVSGGSDRALRDHHGAPSNADRKSTRLTSSHQINSYAVF